MYSSIKIDYITDTKQQLSWTAFIMIEFRLEQEKKTQSITIYMAVLVSAYYELYNKYIQMNASSNRLNLITEYS